MWRHRCVCQTCRSRIDAGPDDLRLDRHGDLYSSCYVVCSSCLQRTTIVVGYEANAYFVRVTRRPPLELVIRTT